MMLMSRAVLVAVAAATMCVLMAANPAKSAEVTAPKVSTFAPAEDLAGQVDRYLRELDESVATEADYKDSESKIAQDANTLVVIALALGLHDQPSKYQASAGTIMKAAEAVAATKDFASAKTAIAALKAAVNNNAPANAPLKWEKVAALPELMKQVPVVNGRLKMNVKGSKFTKRAKDTAGYSAVIAAIAQGTMADTSATKNAEEVKQWQKFSTAMRDSAGAVNAAIHKGDAPATAEAMKKLAQSCDDCHAVFHPEPLPGTDP